MINKKTKIGFLVAGIGIGAVTIFILCVIDPYDFEGEFYPFDFAISEKFSYNVVFVEGLSEEEKYELYSLLQSSFQSWTELNPNLEFHHNRIDAGEMPLEIYFVPLPLGNLGAGGCDPTFCDMFINTLEPDKMDITISHEIGHILGMGHSPDKNNLMFEFFNPLPSEDFNPGNFTIPEILTHISS